MSEMQEIQAVYDAIVSGNLGGVAEATQAALDAGGAAAAILNQGMIAAMDLVGERFKNEEIFVPEMLLSAMTMKAGVEVLKPHLAEAGGVKRGKMVMGTVYGDLHDIGKNLVILMIESAGFEVIDLGIDVPVEKFVETVENDPEVTIVGVSALLTTTMGAMHETVEALNASPARSRFKIMVGGAPVDQAFADEIGADVYTEDAASAAQAAKAIADR